MSEDKEWFSGRGVDEEPKRGLGFREFLILAAVAVILGLLAGCAAAPITQASETKVEHSLVFRATHDDGSPVALRIFTAKPCTDDRVLMFLDKKYGAPPDLLPHFKASILTWQGKDWASCWIEQQGYVVSVDEEGAPFQPVRMSRMKDEAL
jgi:hypothetical protein